MKRTVCVVANDGDIRIESITRISVPNGYLVRTEIESLTQAVARLAADGVRNLPYTNFGPMNTRVL
jgi:hypothetical protein